MTNHNTETVNPLIFIDPMMQAVEAALAGQCVQISAVDSNGEALVLMRCASPSAVNRVIEAVQVTNEQKKLL